MAKTAKNKHIHVIGICGVATSALAIAFHKKGWKVTGSDKGFYPPVSTELEKQGVTYYAGWHPEKMSAYGDPHTVIVGTASGSTNPETAYAKERGIPMYSFAEAIGKFFVRENSVVACGTWGKTSSSALLSHILMSAEYDPSYMFGGISLSHPSSAMLTDGKWSVFEGDEYKSSPTDPKPKFSYYEPTHLLLSAVSWDHADLYPTEKSYFDTFAKLVKKIPQSPRGLIVACTDEAGVRRTLKEAGRDCVSYGADPKCDYSYKNIVQDGTGMKFDIVEKKTGKAHAIKSGLIGSFQAENMTGCFAMAREIGIGADEIIKAIQTFKGMKRRLEWRLRPEESKNGVAIFDDIAHSPEKAASILSNLRKIFNGKIIAIFEPNTGGRERSAEKKYDGAFKDAHLVIIPRLTKLKVASDDKNGANSPMEGAELATVIGKTHSAVSYIDDDVKLVEFIKSEAGNGDAIVFLGSHGFRGMIEECVKSLAK